MRGMSTFRRCHHLVISQSLLCILIGVATISTLQKSEAAVMPASLKGQKREVSYVPYTMRNLTSTSFQLSITIDNKPQQMILSQKRIGQSIDVYVTGEDNSLRNTNFQTGIEFQGRDLNSSYSIFMLNGEINFGVMISPRSYVHMVRHGNGTLKLEKHFGSIEDANQFLEKVLAPKRGKKKMKRSAEEFDSVGKKIEFVIFTEHLLFEKYCELYSLEDPECTEGMEQLTQYATSMGVGAKLYYDRIDNPRLRLLVELKQIIHDVREEDTYTKESRSIFYGMETHFINSEGETEIHVDAAAALDRFAIIQQGYLFAQNWSYDQSTLITLHGLGNSKSPGKTTIGIAYVQGICDDFYKVAICQYKPSDYGWNTVQILAHEIGHNLGATHDGEYAECPEKANYIMSSHNQMTNLANLHYFSCCSLGEIANTLFNDYGECLGDWEEGEDLSEFVDEMPGVKYDRFDQCKSEFNENYLPCHTVDFIVGFGTTEEHKASFQNYVKSRRQIVGVNECLAHWCYRSVVGECELGKQNPVLSGTWCDVGRWCIEGQCIPNTSLSAGPDRPQCNLTNQILTADFQLEPSTREKAETADLYETGDLLGRFAGVIIGAVFFVVGTLSSCLRRRRRSTASSQARQRPNTSYNNSEFQAMMATIPYQYHKVLGKKVEHQVYDVKNYQRQIQKIFKK